MTKKNILIVVGLLALCLCPSYLRSQYGQRIEVPDNREEVVFWHFWGGKDRAVVADVVKRFNDSQDKYWVREIAMPGNNLQAKLFLSTTGGAPPDLVNQDDPILADWARRGVIQAMDEIADPVDVKNVGDWMFDSANRLCSYEGRLFGVCNGLDIRALYYNKTALDQFECSVPQTIAELDQMTAAISPSNGDRSREFYAYLPDSRRLWAWGFVFGGDFYNSQTNEVELTAAEITSAAHWMQSYSHRYGPENIAAFRTGDQSLPGKAFPLLPLVDNQTIGRYLMLMDGQWRTRDIREFNEGRRAKGIAPVEFGVTALPSPTPGRKNSGWVNGNFFVVPKGARNSKGAWEFIKFWIGFTNSQQAAKTCADGGWIPVSQDVVDTKEFQAFLKRDPLFAKFVKLAASPNQFPVPVIPGAPMFRRTVESSAYQLMADPDLDSRTILQEAQTQIQTHLDRSR